MTGYLVVDPAAGLGNIGIHSGRLRSTTDAPGNNSRLVSGWSWWWWWWRWWWWWWRSDMDDYWHIHCGRFTSDSPKKLYPLIYRYTDDQEGQASVIQKSKLNLSRIEIISYYACHSAPSIMTLNECWEKKIMTRTMTICIAYYVNMHCILCKYALHIMLHAMHIM